MAHDSMTGERLGDYELKELIGAGSMGRVYRPEHIHLWKEYALKILPDEVAGNEGFVQRFFDEARVMADWDHMR